jgi:hypothetical protein
MKKQINISLLSTFESKHSVFANYSLGICKNKEMSEDVLQAVALKLVSYEVAFDYKDDTKLIYTMIMQAASNYRLDGKKYVMLAESDDSSNMNALIDQTNECTYEQDLMDTLNLKKIKQEARNLPPKQREAVMRALSGSTLCDDMTSTLNDDKISQTAEYETLKSQTRLAIIKLNKKLA